MKKVLKILLVALGIIVVLGLVFFVIDNNRVSKQEKPIFCIKNPKGIINDGGTIEYFGLGYKIIDFHTLAGFDDIKIGTWAMKYEDFNEEMSKYYINVEENNKESYSKVIDGIKINLDIPDDWNYEEVKEIKNENVKFELKIYKSSKEKSASLCFYKDFFGVCGTGLTSEKLILDNGIEASVGYYDGEDNWNFISFYNMNKNIAFINGGIDGDESKEVLNFVKTMNINNETDTAVIRSFYGKVIETNEKYIIVEPNDGEDIKKSADKISIGLGEKNVAIYAVGTNLKITYDGEIMETYPAQIKVRNIELKSVEKFNLVFYQKTMIQPKQKETIISKGEIKDINYNVYAFEGHIAINLNSDSSELSENSISLREALLQNKITMEEIIAKANKDFPNAVSYDDGGSIEYHYENYTIIKCHSLDGNRDVYIGAKGMTLNDVL